jgi:predicted nucleic acid-binding protein
LPYVDSSFLVALLDTRDRWHPVARRAAPPLLKQRPWRTHTLAMGEVLAVIGSRSGGHAARDAYDAVRDTVDTWAPSLADLDAAMPYVVRFNGALSLSDALFISRMEREEDPTILSFDRDFDKAGLRRLPSM